ncbi:metal-dependent hydrolase [Halorientalis pallida]|uniref:metal-dependent hydrolase n=1 Tax=Halorientalis pallida TaxID=2479928 RepID=UPI003C6F7F02
MLPWSHLGVGYLVYSLLVRVGTGESPRGGPVLAMVLGTQFPDLLDKPLNWWFSVLDGRGIGHSLLTMVPLCVAVYLFARRYDRGPLGAAFGVGVLTHLPGDAWVALLSGEFPAEASYLLWPLLPAPTYPKDSLADHVAAIVASLQEPIRVAMGVDSVLDLVGLLLGLSLRFVFVLVPLLVWRADGYPGLRTVWTVTTRSGPGRGPDRHD